MKLIFAGLLLLSFRAAAEPVAESQGDTQAAVGVVETVCKGACNKNQVPDEYTKPIKVHYKDTVDTINQIDRSVKTPEEIEKSKAKPEEPLGV